MNMIVTGGIRGDWSYFTDHKTLLIALITDFDPRLAARTIPTGPAGVPSLGPLCTHSSGIRRCSTEP